MATEPTEHPVTEEEDVGDVAASEAQAPEASKLISEVAAIAESLEYEGKVLECTLSSGVILECKPVPPLAMREVAIRVPAPQVPTWHNPDKDRDEPNPNDPDYLKALELYQAEQLFRVTEVIMLLGTQVKELPDGFPGPERVDWIEPLLVLGVVEQDTIDHANKWARYLMWLRFYACQTQSDVAHVIGRVIAVSGVTEVEVQRAAAAFLRTTRR